MKSFLIICCIFVCGFSSLLAQNETTTFKKYEIGLISEYNGFAGLHAGLDFRYYIKKNISLELKGKFNGTNTIGLDLGVRRNFEWNFLRPSIGLEVGYTNVNVPDFPEDFYSVSMPLLLGIKLPNNFILEFGFSPTYLYNNQWNGSGLKGSLRTQVQYRF